MTAGCAWELVLIGGPFEGAPDLAVDLAVPPDRILVGRCTSPDRCELELTAAQHPHCWFWLPAERHRPPRVTQYRLLEAAEGAYEKYGQTWAGKARYVPADYTGVGVDDSD